MDQQFEHRAQTNQVIIVGVCTKAPSLKVLTDTETGEATHVSEFTMRVDNGDESTFIQVEAWGDMALSAQQITRRASYQLTGRMIVTDRKGKVTDPATGEQVDQLKDGKPVYYQSFKLRLIDRRKNFDGSENPTAPAPIIAVDAKSRHQAAVLFYGTIGKKGVVVSATQNERVRVRFSAANNGGSKAKPHTSWMNVVAYGDVARKVIGLGQGSLVKVASKLNVFKNGNGQQRCEFIASAIDVIAGKTTSPASAAVDPNADALDILNQLDAQQTGTPYTGALDPESNEQTTEIEGEEHSPETLVGAAAGSSSKRHRAGTQPDGLAA